MFHILKISLLPCKKHSASPSERKVCCFGVKIRGVEILTVNLVVHTVNSGVQMVKIKRYKLADT